MTWPELDSLFPEAVAVAASAIDSPVEPGFEAERICVERAVEKRRREFHAGRACAREAMRKLGVAPCALPREEDGRTVWPEGVVGTISHNDTWCGAAVAPQEAILGLGLDLERMDRFDRRLAERILHPEEKATLSNRSEADFLHAVAVIFSAKEAVFKAVYPVTEFWFGFQDAVIELEENAFRVRLSDEVASRLPADVRLFGSYHEVELSVLAGVTMLPGI